MARPIRVEYEAAVYHVYARGNERRAIFKDEADRRLFLSTLAEMVHQQGIIIHAYCLMPNHYHLIAETPRANLSQGLGWFQVTYTVRYNRRHRRSGHLFQGRYKAQVVDADEYGQELVRYIHLNPVRGRDKSRAIPGQRREELAEYQWSSQRAYAGLAEKPEWLSLSWLNYWGKTKKAAHRNYRAFIENAFGSKIDCLWDKAKGGLVLGDESFREKINSIIAAKGGAEENRWTSQIGREELGERIEKLAEKEVDERVRMWIRVRLGGERLTQVGRMYGYKDGSGVLHAVKRLELAARENKQLSERLEYLKHQVDLSRIKS